MIDQFLPYIIGLIAIVAGLFGYGRVQRSKGRKDAEAEIIQNNLEASQNAKSNYEKVTRIDDLPSEFDRLREKRRR